MNDKHTPEYIRAIQCLCVLPMVKSYVFASYAHTYEFQKGIFHVRSARNRHTIEMYGLLTDNRRLQFGTHHSCFGISSSLLQRNWVNRRINTSTTRATPSQNTASRCSMCLRPRVDSEMEFHFWPTRSWCVVHFGTLNGQLLQQRPPPATVRASRDILAPAATMQRTATSRNPSQKAGGGERSLEETPRLCEKVDLTPNAASLAARLQIAGHVHDAT